MNTVTNDHKASDFQIITSDSMESRFSQLDVDASVKASFLCGQTEVRGSAKYLTDKKKFYNQSRVTFQYRSTTSLTQLMMASPDPKKMEQMNAVRGLATHIVTGILYGANVFFVFDSEKLDASRVRDVQGSMEALIRKIPSFIVEGKVQIKLTDAERALVNKMSCKLYGDFNPDHKPLTFVDAVKTYNQLPGSEIRAIVPLKVWLKPLKTVDPKASVPMGRISLGLVGKAVEALEDVRQLEMRSNDCLEEKVVKCFPQMCQKLSNFQTMCSHYTAGVQEKMAKKVPLIREEREDESCLRKMLEDRDKSPFSRKSLNMWMDHMEREVNVIRSCVEMMEGIKIISNQSELDREVLSADADDVLCFVFTSLNETADTPEGTGAVSPSAQNNWYFSAEVITKIREKAKAFRDLAKTLKNNRVLFFVAAVPNEKHEGASIYLYKDGILVCDDFRKPEVNVEKVTSRRKLRWCKSKNILCCFSKTHFVPIIRIILEFLEISK